MKANHKQTAVKLTASKIATRAMVRVVTKYDKYCLHEVVTPFMVDICGMQLV